MAQSVTHKNDVSHCCFVSYMCNNLFYFLSFQPEICANSLVDIIQAVVNGADGCLFCYGHARLGKYDL